MAQAELQHTTPRTRFEEIIQSIEQEAIAAAHTLGFGGDKKEVLAGIHNELKLWKRDYDYEILGWWERRIPNTWNRPFCLDLVLFLAEELRRHLAVGGRIFDDLADIEHCQAALRRRVPAAAQQAPLMQ